MVGHALNLARRRVPDDGERGVADQVERAIEPAQAVGHLTEDVGPGAGDHGSQVVGVPGDHQLTVGHEERGEPFAVTLVGRRGIGDGQGGEGLLVLTEETAAREHGVGHAVTGASRTPNRMGLLTFVDCPSRRRAGTLPGTRGLHRQGAGPSVNGAEGPMPPPVPAGGRPAAAGVGASVV